MDAKGSKGIIGVVVLISLILALSLTVVSASEVQIEKMPQISANGCLAIIEAHDCGTDELIANAEVVWDDGNTTYTDENGITSKKISGGWHTVNISKLIPGGSECYESFSVDFYCYSCGNTVRIKVCLDSCPCPPVPVPALSPIGIAALVALLGFCGLIVIKRQKQK